MKHEFKFEFEQFNSADELTAEDAQLLNKARETTQHAYAPYSKFRVGAAGQLNNGQVVSGTNQENASYPVGICAERVLLSTAATVYPNIPIKTIAISYHNQNGDSSRPISPCGICRQSLLEYEVRTNQPIRVILSGQTGLVVIISSAAQLLPLCFSATDMDS